MERASASTGWRPRLLLAKLSDAAGTLGCRVETPKSRCPPKTSCAIPVPRLGERSGGGAGGAHLPSFLFGRRAWFSAGGLAGEHRLPHLRAHREIPRHREFGVCGRGEYLEPTVIKSRTKCVSPPLPSAYAILSRAESAPRSTSTDGAATNLVALLSDFR